MNRLKRTVCNWRWWFVLPLCLLAMISVAVQGLFWLLREFGNGGVQAMEAVGRLFLPRQLLKWVRFRTTDHGGGGDE